MCEEQLDSKTEHVMGARDPMEQETKHVNCMALPAAKGTRDFQLASTHPGSRGKERAGGGRARRSRAPTTGQEKEVAMHSKPISTSTDLEGQTETHTLYVIKFLKPAFRFHRSKQSV